MCRIFGFRSVIKSQVHKSLISADNALELQSNEHRDGWGVAYWVAGAPHIIKSETQAISDHIFRRVSGVVSSETVVAHIRRATAGDNHILNTHPFQYGRWVFCHNGNIKDFEKYRETLIQKINPELRRYILGDTDSEVMFYLLLSKLTTYIDLSERLCSVDTLIRAIKDTLKELIGVIGPYEESREDIKEATYLTWLVTNGDTMVAHQGGKYLHYSTYKTKCSDRDTCPSFAKECEAPSKTGYVNHLLFSSEPLRGENVWERMENGQIIGIGPDMKLVMDEFKDFKR